MAGNKQSGRKRKPTAELAILGSPRAKKRIQKEPATLDPTDIQMPADYSETEAGIWKFHVEMLKNLRIISSSDFVTLDMFCRTYSEFLELEQFVKNNGLTYSDVRGVIRLYPEARQRNDTRKELRSLAIQLGLSPSSRAGVERLPDSNEKNPFQGIT